MLLTKNIRRPSSCQFSTCSSSTATTSQVFGIIREDAEHTCGAFDLLVGTRAGWSSRSFPVLRREVTEGEVVFTSLGHGFSCLGERGRDHGAYLIQCLQYSLFLMKELLRRLCPSAVCSHRRRAHHAAALAPTDLWCPRW